MAFQILSTKGKILIRKSIWSLTDDELKSPDIIEQIQVLDKSNIHLTDVAETTFDNLPEKDIFSDLDDVLVVPEQPELTALELHNTTPEELDEYLDAEILLARGGAKTPARVLKR